VEDLPPLTPRMQRSLQRALEIAQENGQDVVGTEHVLLAFLGDKAGIAGMTLHSVGTATATALRAEIVRIVTSEGYKTPRQTVNRAETA
jgi:ATP-dependent Clp protease ATP-binding subunit ClpC